MTTAGPQDRPWDVVVVDSYPDVVGGAHVVTRDLARAGVSTGAFAVRVVLPAPGVTSRWLETHGITVHVVPAPAALLRTGGDWRKKLLTLLWQLPRYWWQMTKALRSADLVHLNDHRGLVLAGPSAALARRPVTWHLHNTVTAGRVGRLIDPLGHRLAAALIVPSPASAARRPGDKTFVLPNTVTGSHRERSPEPGLVLAVGRLHPEKGFDLLLTATATLAQRRHRIRLVIAGADAPGHEAHATELRSRAEQLGNVELLGHVEDLTTLLAQAAVYAQPSRAESLGLAALEASAAGVAVVAAAVGGLPGVVLHDQTGLLYEADNPIALADALEALLQDPDRAERYGSAGAERAREHYSAAQFATRITDIYAAAQA